MQQRERVAELRLQRADPRALLEQRLAADARERALGVIGDGQHAVAARASPRRPSLRATSARRPRPTCARGSRRSARRSAAAACRVSAASISPASSRSTGGMKGRPERRVDLLLGLAGDHLAAVDLGQRVLVQRPARGRARAGAA